MLKGIYAISDTLLTPKDKLEQSLQAAIQGGIALFQLRDKESCDEEIAELCPKLERICKILMWFLSSMIEWNWR